MFVKRDMLFVKAQSEVKFLPALVMPSEPSESPNAIASRLHPALAYQRMTLNPKSFPIDDHLPNDLSLRLN